MINNMAGLSFFRSNKGKRKNDKVPPQTKNVLKDTSSNSSNTFLQPTSVDVAVSFFTMKGLSRINVALARIGKMYECMWSCALVSVVCHCIAK